MSPDRSPWIDDELAMLDEQVGRFVDKELAPRREQWEAEGQVDRASWLKAAEAGILCASIPEEYGGGGGTLAHEAIIHQALSRAGLGGSMGTGNAIHSAIVAHYILAYGTDEQ
jgi:acyl-CoA dehydrogenase